MDPAWTLTFAIALVPALIGAVVGGWTVWVSGRERGRALERQERLDDVAATHNAFNARVAFLSSLLDKSDTAAEAAMQDMWRYSGREFLRYYGSLELVRRWWSASDRISAIVFGDTGPVSLDDMTAATAEFSTVAADVSRALREARLRVARGELVGESLVDDAEARAEMATRRERDKALLRRRIERKVR